MFLDFGDRQERAAIAARNQVQRMVPFKLSQSEAIISVEFLHSRLEPTPVLLSVLLTLTTHAALKANKLVAGDDHGAGRGAGQPGVR